MGRRHHQLSRRGDGGEGDAAEGNELCRRQEVFGFSNVEFFEQARRASLLKPFATPNESLALSKKKKFHE